MGSSSGGDENTYVDELNHAMQTRGQILYKQSTEKKKSD